MKANSALPSHHDGHFITIEVPENRKFSRISFDHQVSLEFINSRHDNCQIKDISLTGLFVNGFFQQQVGENCIINLVQKGVSITLSLAALAKVVRKSYDGIAIKSTAMSFDSYMYLQTSLLYEADEPIVIGLELPNDCPFKIIDLFPTLLNQSEAHKERFHQI